MIQATYPCLWFDGNAKEAATFYCSIIKPSRIIVDTPMVVKFELNGKLFMGLNGGPHFKFNEAVSFVLECDTQEEIDTLWEGLLSGGGKESMCGWLKDRFGVSWQIVPTILGKLMQDPERAPRVMAAFMQMARFDIQKLLDA